jgi:hypothetical protein
LGKPSGNRLPGETLGDVLGGQAMENDQKNEIENVPERKMTRRDMLLLGVLGGGCVLTGLHVWTRRRAKPRNPLGITEITIEGPFEKYGGFTLEALGQQYVSKIASDFELLTFSISQGKYYDQVFIMFTFTGKEDPDRKMKVSFSVYDKEGKMIGETEHIFRDPRIMARERKNSGFTTGAEYEHPPVASLSTRLDVGKDCSHVSRVEIFAMELRDS